MDATHQIHLSKFIRVTTTILKQEDEHVQMLTNDAQKGIHIAIGHLSDIINIHIFMQGTR